MLSGEEIIKEVENGNIVIKPFNKEQVNPNSYNLKLGDELVVYTDDVLDCKKENKTRTIKIPEEGYTLAPNTLYLASTLEYTECPKYVSQISGRSSIGRIGLTTHISAGFGSVGFKGSWTLGISCVTPVKVHAGMEICQLYFFQLVGSNGVKYSKKYINQGEIMTSKMYKDFENE
jgi:dCTP deaminase